MKKILVTKPPKAHNSKSNFKESVCVLAISVGQKAHEGENLAATIDYINNNFKSCTIALGDSLQRHNFTFLYSLDSRNAYKKSLAEGNSWLERNKPIYNELRIPFQITRWDEWLNHEDYKAIESKLRKIYKKDEKVREAFEKTSEDFKERFKKILMGENIEITAELLEKVKEKSIEYLKEESIIMTAIWATEGYNYILYPSPILEAVERAREKLLDEKQEHFSKWLELSFERVNMEQERYKGLIAGKYHNVEMIMDENTLVLKRSKMKLAGNGSVFFKNHIDKSENAITSVNELPFKTVQIVGTINNILMELNQDICLKNEKPQIESYFYFILLILEKFKSEIEEINSRKASAVEENKEENGLSSVKP